MRLAKKYAVPSELALLYEFLNTADLRTYVEKQEPHEQLDELETPAQLAAWMRERDLLKKGESISSADHRRALELRSALRAYLQLPPGERTSRKTRESLNRVCEHFPLVVKLSKQGEPELRPAQGADGLARIVAEFFLLGASNRLDRLKMCSSEECHWIFFDRSKPGNRRWCSSLLCGNRQKTRDYRKRAKAKTIADE